MGSVPRLSVGLPVFNGETVIEETLESLLGQTFRDFELIISDNCSTDGTESICRRYARQDSRISYFRQRRNVGAALNHNFTVGLARGEFFKWSSADDLCARDFLQGCVEALDQHPEVILAHSWTALIDSAGVITEAVEYPSDTGAPCAPDRFRSMLEGGRGSDDYGGVMRLAGLRQTPLFGSHHFADRTLFTELALRGPFYHIPDWLHFRRVHAEGAYRLYPTIRQRCANFDPRRADRLKHPAVRLYAEYAGGFVASIHRVPMSPEERRQCYGHLGRFFANRAIPSAGRVLRGGTLPRLQPLVDPLLPALLLDDIVAGRHRSEL